MNHQQINAEEDVNRLTELFKEAVEAEGAPANVRPIDAKQLSKILIAPPAALKNLNAAQILFVTQLPRRKRKAMLSELRRGRSFEDARERARV